MSAVITEPLPFDWRNPDYQAIFAQRAQFLQDIRTGKVKLAKLKAYYKEHPADFINDFGMTVDPRNPERGLPSVIPFILFPRQREWVDFVMRKWKSSAPGITKKSRDMGISWLATSLASTLCLFYKDLAIGFGSATEIKIDRLGDPDCLFYKARAFMENIPEEFKDDWDSDKHAPYMRLKFPGTGSTITGEAGDNIGRGGRKSIYFVDEAAHLERPKIVDASLSNTTNCRQDLSSVNGTTNTFYEKCISGNIEVFEFHWRQDPRKDQAWYDKKVLELNDPVVVAQEIDMDFSAAVEGVLIPSAWVQAAIDAHLKLGIDTTGVQRGALDVADQGKDKNCFGSRKGCVLTFAKTWTGKLSDIYATTEHAFTLCDIHALEGFDADADGLGAGVRGDARKINEDRKAKKIRTLEVGQFRGSGGVLDPEREMVPGRKNKDFFQNYKAQSYWSLSRRFEQTYRAVNGLPHNRDLVLSISSEVKDLNRLCAELSQPTWSTTGTGKVQIDKAPDGAPSPNMADMVNILYAPRRPPMRISTGALNRIRGRG